MIDPTQVTSKINKLQAYFTKMKGSGNSPLLFNWKDGLTAFIGGTITLLILLELTQMTDTLWFMAPFGSSCLLVFVAWNGPVSQPRNIIGGHVLASLVGLVILKIAGNGPVAIAFAVGIAMVVVMFTKTTHPPAAANPIIIMVGHYNWEYIVTPVLIGSLIIVILALIINNLRSARQYPTFWW